MEILKFLELFEIMERHCRERKVTRLTKGENRLLHIKGLKRDSIYWLVEITVAVTDAAPTPVMAESVFGGDIPYIIAGILLMFVAFVVL